MGSRRCVLAIDQGTTSSRAILFDGQAVPLASAQREIAPRYPREGWVEQDQADIWQSALAVARRMVNVAEAQQLEIVGLGITNQRETTLVWEAATGRPIQNAIVWQDRRTAEHCARLRADGAEPLVRERTGLLLDPYFSATKLAWILDHTPGGRERAVHGELLFGTVDSYLIWQLTAGREHATDATNASRTGLYNIHSGQWDEELLRLYDIPARMLPTVRDSNAHFGRTEPSLLGRELPILGVAGDQQAASLGQCCFHAGDIKSTYGTGCFMLMNTGDTPRLSQQQLLTTIAYQIDGRVSYALEGAIFNAGATVQWLRDQLGVIREAAETETLARSIDGNHGVYLVPAFTGLGVPHWSPDARGALLGLTRGSGRAEIARAALEAVGYQSYDLFAAMVAEGERPTTLRVDGGMVGNSWMLQFLADLLQVPVLRSAIQETTALGAAYLAGRGAGLYGDFDAFSELWRCSAEFQPKMPDAERQTLLQGWTQAVQRVIATP